MKALTMAITVSQVVKLLPRHFKRDNSIPASIKLTKEMITETWASNNSHIHIGHLMGYLSCRQIHWHGNIYAYKKSGILLLPLNEHGHEIS